MQSGVLSGQSLSLLTGDPSSQVVGNATHVVDLGSKGFLGVGQLDGLDNSQGVLSLRYTQLDETTPSDVVLIEWGVGTQLFLITGESLVWDGSDRFDPSAWAIQDDPTPGDYDG